MAQALARQATIEADTYATLSALGCLRGASWWCSPWPGPCSSVSWVRSAVVVLAFLLSPLTLGGRSQAGRLLLLGSIFDTLALLLGALAAIVAVLALGLWPAIRTGSNEPTVANRRRVARPSRIVALLTGRSAPRPVRSWASAMPSNGDGDDNAVPVGSAMLGSILAVTALVRHGGVRRQPHPSDRHSHPLRSAVRPISSPSIRSGSSLHRTSRCSTGHRTSHGPSPTSPPASAATSSINGTRSCRCHRRARALRGPLLVTDQRRQASKRRR